MLPGPILNVRFGRGLDDPQAVLVIRRATSYRNSHHHSSVPLDELVFSKFHCESTLNYGSSDNTAMKCHELITAQSAAIRATPRAIISLQTS